MVKSTSVDSLLSTTAPCGRRARLTSLTAGHFTDALGVAHAPEAKDSVLEVLFAIVLLDASIIGAAAVTLSTRQGWPVRPALFRRALL